MKESAPPYHVWTKVEENLWQCIYCRGWCARKNKPYRVSVAVDEYAAKDKALTLNAQEH